MINPAFFRKLSGIILSLIFILSGCQLTPTLPPENTATVPSSISESPLPTVVSSVAESPVPTPIPEATPLPKPESGTGSVSGALIWFLQDNQISATAATLYLAPVLEADDGIPRLASLDTETDPMTVTDEFGRFAFLNLKPGRYVLIYSIPGFKEFMLNERGNEGRDLFIVIEADKITELDPIVANFPL